MNILKQYKKYLALLSLLFLQACNKSENENEKMIADFDAGLTQSYEYLVPSMKLETCYLLLQDSLPRLPFDFIDIGGGIFQSNAVNWRAYIQCEEGKTLLTVQSKMTINPSHEKLDTTNVKDKLNLLYKTVSGLYLETQARIPKSP